MNRSLTEWGDADLALLARDDYSAFEILYQRHVTAVYRYCYGRTHNTADAEDLTAQTFLAALEAIPRYKDKGNFSAWLFGIAHHKCADFYRARYADPSDNVENLTRLEDPDYARPEAELIQQELWDCVQRMLKVLSTDRREALHLRYWGGLKMTDIAQIMHRSEAAVKMLLARGLTDLRERCVR